MSTPFAVPLEALQPSQLYVCREKLAHIEASDAHLDPLPVLRHADVWMLTDGHTRALSAWRAGWREVQVRRDEDEPGLDLEAYAVCVTWCREEGIRHIGHLADRVVDSEEYERLWIARCARLHASLRAKRHGT